MTEAKTSAAESSRTVFLTAASLITAIMIERLVGGIGELSDGQVLWGSTSAVLVQSALIDIAIVNWWEFFAMVTSVGRWVLTPLDLLAPIAIGAIVLLMIENLSHEVTTEFLALGTIGFLGGVVLSRTVVAGVRRGLPSEAAAFDSYPDRWTDLLFMGISISMGVACLLRFATDASPVVLNAFILLAAALDATVVLLHLRWWSRVTQTT
jgi:hypothetical protein